MILAPRDFFFVALGKTGIPEFEAEPLLAAKTPPIFFFTALETDPLVFCFFFAAAW